MANSNKLYIAYGSKEIEYLKGRDPALAAVIDKVGHIKRSLDPDLFSALANSIIGQQISMKAQAAIWGRFCEAFNPLTAQGIYDSSAEELKACGLSDRKAEYMKGIAAAIVEGRLDLDALENMSDDEVASTLSKLKGVGVWTAEMLMMFSMGRMDVLSYGDLAIQRGLRMLYRHRKITPALYKKYKRRYSPYASVASLYLWEVAGGVMPELYDLGSSSKKKK